MSRRRVLGDDVFKGYFTTRQEILNVSFESLIPQGVRIECKWIKHSKKNLRISSVKVCLYSFINLNEQFWTSFDVRLINESKTKKFMFSFVYVYKHGR